MRSFLLDLGCPAGVEHPNLPLPQAGKRVITPGRGGRLAARGASRPGSGPGTAVTGDGLFSACQISGGHRRRGDSGSRLVWSDRRTRRSGQGPCAGQPTLLNIPGRVPYVRGVGSWPGRTRGASVVELQRSSESLIAQALSGMASEKIPTMLTRRLLGRPISRVRVFTICAPTHGHESQAPTQPPHQNVAMAFHQDTVTVAPQSTLSGHPPPSTSLGAFRALGRP